MTLLVVVKLHSDLRILTQLQLVGEGVDFVFPWKKNPHLDSSIRNDPTCLNFGDCLVGVWKVFGNCLEGVWQVSGGCLVGVWCVSGGCLRGVWKVHEGCLEGIYGMFEW